MNGRLVHVVRSRTFLYAAAGFGLGAVLTVAGWMVDYFALYKTLPTRFSFALIQGLHQVTPVHYFADFFALLLGAAGGAAGWFQDRVIFYSNHLEDLVEERTVALRRSEERYALAARGANDGLWDWDLEKDRVYYSPRWKQNLGFRDRQVGDTPGDWLGRVHPGDRKRVRARIDNHLAGANANFSVEYRIRHADGTYRWMLARGMAVRDDRGRPYRMAGSQTDIDERKKMEQQLMFMALHDPLTELPNRTLFHDRIGHAFDRARGRHGRSQLAILFIDVDRFKSVNDSLGHLLGDRLLVEIAGRIKSALEAFRKGAGRSGDPETHFSRTPDVGITFARMGGDEFTVLLEDIHSLHEATRVARIIEDRFGEPFPVEGRKLFVTLSTGIVLGPSGYERAEDLLRDADTAMYRAKANGRARIEIFDQEMLAKVQEQLRLETDLQEALERGEFRVVYHPTIDLESGSLTGFESLCRWHHPKHGSIDPEDFIPMAEEAGVSGDLGRWLFNEACRQFRVWDREVKGADRLILGVNLSPRQLFDAGLLAEFRSAAKRSRLDPERIYLEISENTLIDDPEEVVGILNKLKKGGFRIAIDDFGTGYSSLAMLRNLPVDILKIDKSFVKQLGEDEAAEQILDTIVKLAGALDLGVIAEGIETSRQLRKLRDLGCSVGQGNWFARPQDAAGVESNVFPNFPFAARVRSPKRRRSRVRT